MLNSLHIENYALIQKTDISFAPGFVVITGETGAGKSILLGALGMLMGGRADTAVLADKECKCVVEAVFDITGFSFDIDPSLTDELMCEDQLILRREILPTGRSRAFANDMPVPLKVLGSMASQLVDIHSQNETAQLSNPTFRLALLDSLGDAVPLARYQSAFAHYHNLKVELERLTSEETKNRREQDFMQFQLDELVNARLVVGEQETLEQELQILEHAEAIRDGYGEAASILDGDDDYAVLMRLRDAKSALSRIASYHPDTEELLKRLDSSFIELDDINSCLQHVVSNFNYDSGRQQEVEERLAELYRLEKKHGVDGEEALLTIRDDLDDRLQSIASKDERIKSLMEDVDAAFTAMQSSADALAAERRKAGKILSESILPTLHSLGMPEARFAVELLPSDIYMHEGHETAVFLFNANRGGELRDMSTVASGGEKSRLMLAVKSMVNTRRMMPTVVFDEIDTGVSGDISVAVGTMMRRMAETMQVVAITHLPQIAARGTHHLKVYKETQSDRTVSRIRELTGDERVVEVATMLSNDPPTAAAMQTAKELMV